MASSSPSTASLDWLLRATAKREKAIFRSVEYKYRNIILGLSARIKELEDYAKRADSDIKRLENELFDEQKKKDELRAKLRVYENPNVAVKDLREEIFRVKTVSDQIDSEEMEKKKTEVNKESEGITTLRDASPSKILEVGPLSRSILPLGTSKTSKGIKRGRSTSLKPVVSQSQKKNKKEEQNTQAVLLNATPPRPLVANKKKRKRKKDKKEES